MGKDFIDRTGEIGDNNYGSKMKIIQYNNANNIIVEFENGYKKKSRYIDFKNGIITICNKVIRGHNENGTLTGMPEKKLKSDSSYRTLLLCD
jgi:hypothetical protein